MFNSNMVVVMIVVIIVVIVIIIHNSNNTLTEPFMWPIPLKHEDCINGNLMKHVKTGDLACVQSLNSCNPHLKVLRGYGDEYYNPPTHIVGCDLSKNWQYVQKP
jgi:hypothetical protein